MCIINTMEEIQMAKEPMHNLCGLARIRSAYPSLTPAEKRGAGDWMKQPE